MTDFDLDDFAADDLVPVYSGVDRIYRIDPAASAQQMELIFNDEAVEAILREGMALVVSASRQILLSKARRSTGLLAQSVMAATGDHFASGVISVALAWRKIRVKRSMGVTRAANATYVDKNGVVKHYRGAGERSKARRAVGSYTDSSGRIRRVSNTADYGGILEYSETRKLRHMSAGYAQAQSQAVALMQNKFDALMRELETAALGTEDCQATVAL